MKNIVLTLLAVLAVLAVPALAAGFTVAVGPAGEIFAEDTMSITVTIHNDAGSDEMFMISQPLAAPPANKWASMDKGSIFVPAYSDGTFNIIVTPFADANQGYYNYEFTVKKQSTGELVSSQFQISVKQRLASAGAKLSLSCSECTRSVIVTADVENFGTAKLKDAVLTLKLGEKAEELQIGDMNLSAKKQVTADFDLSTLKPGDYSVSAELTASSQSLDSETASFVIPEINNITITPRTEITPWSKSVIYRIENLGNMPGNAEIRAEVTQSAAISISYTKTPSTSGDVWTWTETVQPGETKLLSYTEFYWPVPIIIVLAALAGVYVYLFMTSIGMKKAVSKKGNEWSVSIYIKNRGPAAEGVVVRDVIPHHFSLSGTFETLKPIARKTESGTELIWRVGGIKRGEEKLLHYRMTAKSHFNTARLPAARLRAQKGDKTLLSSTNTVNVAGEKGPVKLHVETDK